MSLSPPTTDHAGIMTLLLTIPETAAELQISAASVRRLIAAGKIPVVYPIARRPRIARAELMAYIERITPAPANSGNFGTSMDV